MSEKQRNPGNDPFACDTCGCYLGMSKRIAGESHCDSCLDNAGFLENGKYGTDTEQEADR
jgi:hypothetical protein